MAEVTPYLVVTLETAERINASNDLTQTVSKAFLAALVGVVEAESEAAALALAPTAFGPAPTGRQYGAVKVSGFIT